MLARCGACRFFFEGRVCRRYPPGLLAGQHRVWPTVNENDFCGEFAPLYYYKKAWWEFWR